MRRINVKGSSGAGKTTFARALAERLALPCVELDQLYHGPNWTHPTSEELQAKVRAFIDTAPDGWVIDGNYEAQLGGLVLDVADTIVWLDLPLPFKLRRLWRRTIGRIRGELKLWNENTESWRGAFLGLESLFVWAIRSHVRHRLTWPRRFAGDARLVRLRSAAEAREWLDRLPSPPPPRQRVIAYVTRRRAGRKELLVFDLPEQPDQPTQLPAGRIDPGESLEEGLERELYEETGLRPARIVRRLAEPYELENDRRPGVALYENHAFEVEVDEDTPDQWDHVCISDGDDNGYIFRCRWVPLAPDLKLWKTGSDCVLPRLLA
jgi:8-oxo-dGTP pyrophosphatase MutT (NUDIX family)